MLRPAPGSPSPLLLLPPELLDLITANLLYPDLLALRHSHPTFYYSLLPSANTNIWLKVAWLLDRKQRGLSCPLGNPSTAKRLNLKTDRDFCQSVGGGVKRMMEKRRGHWDCGSGKGECEVVRGRQCGGKRRWRHRSTSWISKGLSFELALGIFVVLFAILTLRVRAN